MTQTSRRLTLRFLSVWRRNLVVYGRVWQVNFLVPLMEPIFYIMAFGMGFSGLIGNVDYAGRNESYVAFMAPALVAMAVMYNAFFETSYVSFVRMFYQKTFDAMLTTPLSLEEVIVAEVVWAASKAMLAGCLITVVLAFFKLVSFPLALLIPAVAFLGGLAFGAVGMFCTGVIPSIDMFNIPTYLFITPMFLFSGTFFPVATLPAWGRGIAAAFPLYHLTELCRFCLLGRSEGSVAAAVGYLAVFAGVFLWLGMHFMRRRLVR